MAPDLYPLSTQDGQAIPHEVVEGLALRVYAITANNTLNTTIPVDWSLCYVYATADCVLRNDATPLPAGPALLANATTYDRTFFIPANTLMVVVLNPTVISIKSLGFDGSVMLTSIRKWAGLIQTQQSSVQ